MTHALLVAENPDRLDILNDVAAKCGSTLTIETLSELQGVPDRMAEGGIGIVLLDVGDADIGSFDELARISGFSGLDVPVIVLHDGQPTDVERLAVDAGAGDALAWSELTPALLRRCVGYCLERANSRRELAQLALIDGETGLARTPLFWEVLSLAVHRARRNQDYLALLAVNLDNLDTAANPRAAVREAANRLTGLLRASDTVARFEGELLMVLVEGMPRVEDIQTVAEKIIERVGEPMAIGGESLSLNASVGISLYPTVSLTPEALVGDATGAMYAAIEDGGSIFKFA